MKGSYLGCSFPNSEIVDYLVKIKAPAQEYNDDILFDEVWMLDEEDYELV